MRFRQVFGRIRHLAAQAIEPVIVLGAGLVNHLDRLALPVEFLVFYQIQARRVAIFEFADQGRQL